MSERTPLHQRERVVERASSDEERLMAILMEARSAPLPSSSSLDRSSLERHEGIREERRRAQVQWLAQLIQRAPAQVARERSVRRRWLVGVAAFAAAAAAVLFVGNTHTPNSAVPAVVAVQGAVKLEQVLGKVVATRADGRDEVLTAGMVLNSGDRVSTTAESFASLGLEAGIRVDLASATTLAVTSNQEIDLRVGRVDVNVPKLPGVSRRLSVNTPDTKVVVRGTIFSVEVASADMSRQTRVGVTRGAVSVFYQGKESRVDAGQLWNSARPREREPLLAEEAPKPEERAVVAPPPPEAAVEPPQAKAPAPARKRRASEPPAQPAPEPSAKENETPASSLSRQNAIFERGLRARDQGDAERAAYWFDQLLRRYPTSPLAEAAERERAAARAQLRGD